MRSSQQALPLTIIGGFLGSGKTSLLNHILTHASGKRIAVLVNDFGEINMDARLIAAIDGDTVSLANGCICCNIRDDLLSAIVNLFARDPLPEHIVIETSGVSQPTAVAESLLDSSTHGLVQLHAMISMLDAETALGDEADYRDMAFEQLRMADLVVINKTDLVPAARHASLQDEVEAIAPGARIQRTTFGKVPLDLIFDARAGGAAATLIGDTSRTHPHDRNLGSQFSSWTFRSDQAWSFNALQRAVEQLPSDIFRAKGIVRLDVGRIDHGVLQLTGRRSWLRVQETTEAGPVATELVFVGRPGFVTNDSLRAHFEQAMVAAPTAGHGEDPFGIDLRAFNIIFG